MKTRLSFVALLAVGVGAGALVQLRAAEPQESAVSQADESPADETAPKRPAKAPAREVDPDAPGVDPEKIDWSKVNWRRRLTREQFRILRQAGTERAFTGDLWDVFEPGRYDCAGCGLPLFESDSKFDSHCGWPSFDRPIAENTIVEFEDRSHGMHRIEVRCRRCGGHLGHVFNDGPTETGLRYCINSASMKLVPEQMLAADAVAEAAAAAARKLAAAREAEQARDAATETDETPAADQP